MIPGSFASKYSICYVSMASLNKGTLHNCNWWNKYVIKSLSSTVLVSDDVIRQRLSLILRMYLETSSPNWDKVESLIFRLIDSTNAMLFLWMLLHIIHKSKGPSFRYCCGIQFIIVMQNSSVMEPKRR